jgi:pyruvate/2-oxoglutarate dehydrogenase complex dihydrolipoamide dehydrogenase (E3) component
MSPLVLLAANACAYSLRPIIRQPRSWSISMEQASTSIPTATPPAAQIVEPTMPVGSVSPEELSKQYDLVVIGGGPAGVAGALKAAQIGKRVLIVDKPKAAPAGGGLDFGFGGPTGLFSKALRDVGKSLDIDSMRAMGLDQDVIWGQVRNNCLRLAGNNANNVCGVISSFRIGYLQGEATLSVLTPYADQEGQHALTVIQHANREPVNVTTKKVLLCLGSKPTRVSSIPFDDVRIFDSDSVNSLGFLPRSVIIVGSGISALRVAPLCARPRPRS